jgi:hypothetical protein
MRWSVYVDLSHPLNAEEQASVTGAIDALVPDGGCVGPRRSGEWEIYFVVESATPLAAEETATALVAAIMTRASVEVGTTIHVHPQSR